MNIVGRLISYCNRSPKNDIYRNVIIQLLKHSRELDDLTIYDMSEMCYASPATFSRLSRKLGFQNFSEFKTLLVGGVKGYTAINRCMPYMPSDDLDDTAQTYYDCIAESVGQCRKDIDVPLIERIVEEMGRMEDIVFYSAFSDSMTSGLQQDIIMSGRGTGHLSDINAIYEDLKQINEKAMTVVILPNLSESAEMAGVIKTAKENGAVTTIVCAAKRSPYEKHADFALTFNGSGTKLDSFSFQYCFGLMAMAYRKRYMD